MISSVGYVPLNVLKRRPVRAEVTQEDLVQLRRRLEGTGRRRDDGDTAEMEIDGDRNEAIRNAETAAQRVLTSAELPISHDPDVEEAMKELDLDAYDSDDDGTHASFFDQIVAARPVDASTENEAKSGTSEEDEDSDEDSVLEYEQGDVVVLATKAEDILSGIEVWVYEEADDHREGNLFAHHDISLTAYPLCCAYLDVQPKSSESRHLVAVGSMMSDIEVYDLDVLDPISPVATLHIDSKKGRTSTMSLSVNEQVRNVMASGGDDKRLRVWDLATGSMTSEMKLHRSTVQSIEWNPKDPPILISGGHDKKSVVTDVRKPDGEVLKWKLDADCECVTWWTQQPTCYMVSDEDGTVQMFDARKGSKSDPLFRMAAHKESATVLSVCPLQSSLFATGSEDGKLKVWHNTNDAMPPQLVEKRTLSVGEILAGGFCKYAGHLVIGAGDSGHMQMWDLRASANITQYFPDPVSIPRIYKAQ